MLYYTQFPSPAGAVTVIAEDSYIVRIDFREPPAGAARTDTHPVLRDATRWLHAYFSGQRPDPSSLPVKLTGTLFQISVWERLREIPYGASVTYGHIAKQLGCPGASQAVGGAVGANPISIAIPCHRVLGAGGKLTGYAGGLDKKRCLLTLEGIPFSE